MAENIYCVYKNKVGKAIDKASAAVVIIGCVGIAIGGIVFPYIALFGYVSFDELSDMVFFPSVAVVITFIGAYIAAAISTGCYTQSRNRKEVISTRDTYLLNACGYGLVPLVIIIGAPVLIMSVDTDVFPIVCLTAIIGIVIALWSLLCFLCEKENYRIAMEEK